MLGISRYAANSALLALGLVIVGVTGQTRVAAQTPTAAQLEAFRNLPPDQQQQIMEQVGRPSDGVQRDADVLSPETVIPRPVPLPEETGTLDGELIIRGRDSLLVDAKARPLPAGGASTLDERASTEQQAIIKRVLDANPYKLDANGILRLPGIRPIPLAGLTEAQANARLASEPALRYVEARVTLLPLEKLDAEALRPFGYDLFAGVPSEYVIGPGDRFEVQLLGTSKGRYSLVVNRDGRVSFPDLGPIAVTGLRVEDAKARIESRVTEQMIGTQAVVTMGDLRSIRVFVLGEAERPGSYTVSGLATVTNALFASGGVKTIGSLRNIQLRRAGVIVQRLDLYDLLLNGDTSNDARLLPGDVIFIPPVGATVGVTGQIRRPAIYELAGESTAADLLYLGGGLTPEADPALATLERINERREREVVDLDLRSPQSRGTRLRTGDLLRIPGTRPTFSNAIRLDGHVHRPGLFQYRTGLRLTDVIPSVEELKPGADLNYVLIRREDTASRRVSALSADLSAAWRGPATPANVSLAPGDQVFVFDFASGRQQFVDPMLKELRLQGSLVEPSRVVKVLGPVRAPGEYPLEPGMTVRDLVRAGGGLSERAVGREAELVQYAVNDGDIRRTDVRRIDLAKALAGDPSANMLLGPFDSLVVKEISEWTEQEAVRLEGEVRFPGIYPISRGETLQSVLARAGGLTPLAFAEGSVFTRESLAERERQQLKFLAGRLRQDLAALALQSSQSGGQVGAQASESLAIGQSLLNDLENAQPVGRLVIDLERALAAETGSTADVILRAGDRLHVPKISQEVTVIGEVQSPTSHLFDPTLSREDYLRLSGGPTQKADEGRIYVVRASGSVEVGSGSAWFRNDGGIRPGDTIVVPIDADRMRPLLFWQSVTTILYNIAVAVAAVNSF
jgi:protein involved in polysaccharide export with SLBB domain